MKDAQSYARTAANPAYSEAAAAVSQKKSLDLVLTDKRNCHVAAKGGAL